MGEAAVAMRRLLLLRQFPALAGVELTELAMVADNAVEVTFAAGSVLATAGAKVPALHLVTDGRIEARRGEELEVWGARRVFGLLEVLADRAAAVTAIAAVGTRTLRVAAADAIEVLEDNFGLQRAMMCELARRLLAASPMPTGSQAVPVHAAAGPLSLVERIIALRQHVLFARGALQPLAAIAHDAEEVSWLPGAVIARAGDLAQGTTILLDGAVRALEDGKPATALGPGDTIGALETLAGAAFTRTLEAASPVHALVCPAASMVDVLEDYPELGLLIIGTLAGVLLDRASRPGIEVGA